MTSNPSSSQSQWLIYAIASGGCAALNGAFAKLTTTQLTSTWAHALTEAFHADESTRRIFEILVRGTFFTMNLVFNGVMWGLFTKALTLASSTVRVSVINTSANFVLTALLGLVVFGEELPVLWWLGASLLVTGSVIIGQREEDEKDGGTVRRNDDADQVSKDSAILTTGREKSDSLRKKTRSRAS